MGSAITAVTGHIVEMYEFLYLPSLIIKDCENIIPHSQEEEGGGGCLMENPSDHYDYLYNLLQFFLN